MDGPANLGPGQASPTRDETVTAASAPVPLAPATNDAGEVRFRWSPTSKAKRIRLVLFDSAGTATFEGESGDTTLVLPDSVRLARDALPLEGRSGDVIRQMGFVGAGTVSSGVARTRSGRVLAVTLGLLASSVARAQEPLVTENPDSARRAIENLLALAAPVDTDSAGVLLTAAERLAAGFAQVWGDSVPGRTVAWFHAAGRDQRLGKAAADSLRRAGGTALRAEGLEPALRLWRASLGTQRPWRRDRAVAAPWARSAWASTARVTGQREPLPGPAYRLALAIEGLSARGHRHWHLASVRKDRGTSLAPLQAVPRSYGHSGRESAIPRDGRRSRQPRSGRRVVGGTSRGPSSIRAGARAQPGRFGPERHAALNLINLGRPGGSWRGVRQRRASLLRGGPGRSTSVRRRQLGRRPSRSTASAGWPCVGPTIARRSRASPAALAFTADRSGQRGVRASHDLSPRRRPRWASPGRRCRTLRRAERELGADSGLTDADRACGLALAGPTRGQAQPVRVADRRLRTPPSGSFGRPRATPVCAVRPIEGRGALLDLRRRRLPGGLEPLRSCLRQALRVRGLAGRRASGDSAPLRLRLGGARRHGGGPPRLRREQDAFAGLATRWARRRRSARWGSSRSRRVSRSPPIRSTSPHLPASKAGRRHHSPGGFI